MVKPFTDFKTATDGSRPSKSTGERPVVGLSVNIADETSRLHEAYVNSVLEAGGAPVLMPASTDPDALRRAAESVDCLILTGGADVGGEYFGEATLEGLTDVIPERDAYDFLLLRIAADRQLPIFGICRGAQVINIAFGGDIWQDIPSQYPGGGICHNILTPREKPAHSVSIEPDSVLSSVFGKLDVKVNSRHHQAIKRVASGFRATAVSDDGVTEAIEAYPARRILGVQWHPENMAAEDCNEDMKALFRFFVSEAKLFCQAKRVHEKYLTVDSHCDTPMLFEEHTVDIGRRDPVAQCDLVKMSEGKLDAAFIVAYIEQGARDDASLSEATQKAVLLLEEMRRQIDANAEYATQAFRFDDADISKQKGIRSIFLGLENGYAIGKDIGNLERFREMGVVYITLCHNGANDICDSAIGVPEHGGLSAFGKHVVHEMNRLGIVIDLSHAAESTFNDVLKESSVPVICSHSSAKALCDHPRNLTDDQIRALAAKDGVVQVCLYGGFLIREREATIQDALDHIDYIVSLVGTNHVGIGSDFDGGGGIEGCNGSNEIINITVELLRRGYSEENIGKILGGNMRRVIDAVQRERKDY